MATESPSDTPPLSGWEPTAPPQDTVLRQFLRCQAEFQRASGAALGATIVTTDRFVAVDTGRPASMVDFVLLLQPLHGPAIAQTMAEIETIVGQPGATGSVALYSPIPTPDLSPWGWSLAGHPPLQLRSPYTPPLAPPAAVVIEPVATERDLATFEQIMIEGFGMEEMHGRPAGSLLGPRLLADDRFRAWTGSLDGEPVSGAASMTSDGIVVVVMVATLPAARRRGAAMAVTQAAARPDLELPAILFSSDEGRGVYERLGFVPLLRGAFWYRNR